MADVGMRPEKSRCELLSSGARPNLLDATADHFQADSRAIGAWMYGSVGAESEDEHSDVDPVFLVTDEAFDAIDGELRPMFDRLCEKIVLWWPEGINSMGLGIKNYAILFDNGGGLLQYDMTIMKQSSLAGPYARGLLVGVTLEQILFDHTGAIRAAVDAFVPDKVSPEHLVWMIGRFWVYAYIHIKYLLRGDVLKLRYAQQMLFESHIVALEALNPHWSWSWWPLGAKHAAAPESRRALLDYFGAADRDGIQAAFFREIDAFSRDAKAACEAVGADYPQAVEAEIRGCMRKALRI